MKCIVNNIATCREYLLISASVEAPDQWVCLHLNYCYKQYIVVKIIMYRNKCKNSHCCSWITTNIFSPKKKNSIYCLFSLNITPAMSSTH